MKISIITIVKNGSTCLEKTILSIINQTYSDIEYLIIDGGSNDGTIEIIQNYVEKIKTQLLSHISFVWISEPDKGIYDAMNKGICMANGKWINFMNCGDTFYDNNVVQSVFQNKFDDNYTDIIYGDCVIESQFGAVHVKPLPVNCLVSRMPFSHQSVFVRSSLMKSVGFDSTFKSSGDYHFFYESYKKNRIFEYIPIVISCYNRNESGISCNAPLVWKENARIWGMNHQISFQMKYYVQCFIWKSKRILKKLMPQKLIKNSHKKYFESLGTKPSINLL